MNPLSDAADGELDAEPPLLPQDARKAAAISDETRRRIRPLPQLRGSSIPTLVAFTDAMAITPGFRPSSSADSRVINDTIRCGPAWISTWAATPSLITRVTMPTKRLRADSLTAAGASACG